MRYLLIALFALACTRQSEDVSARAAQTSTTTASPAATTTPRNPIAPPEAGVAPPSVDVQLIEYSIQVPDSLTAGKHTFAIANAGKEQHGLVIEGKAKLSQNLERGDRSTLDVVLEPGTYIVYCPVDGHRGKGMEKTITVK